MVCDCAFSGLTLRADFAIHYQHAKYSFALMNKFVGAWHQSRKKSPKVALLAFGKTAKNQPKFLAAKSQLTSLSKKVSTNLGRMLR